MAQKSHTAFAGDACIGAGTLVEVALSAKVVLDRWEGTPVLIFDDQTGETIEVDFRGTAEEVQARLASRTREPDVPEALADAERSEPRGPGRPRLGVVAREVTLLPRHWEWLNGQPGGASVALRKLVEEARRSSQGKDRERRSQEAAYRFMSTLAGDRPGFEEAIRALFAGERARFEEQVATWPSDVRNHAAKLAAAALGSVHEDAGHAV
ncbi:MAG: DUF2239 family protein [Isosphaeraceae bacterium]|nr:DUF2239 family protein [Isosphaeraceae bacterium]